MIKRLIRFALVGYLSALLTIVFAGPSNAQFSLPEFGQPSGLNVPPEVTRLGSIEVATVHSPISGEELFKIASPTIYDRSAGGSDLIAAVERRAKEVNARLRRATLDRRQPPMDPETLAVEIGTLNGATVITAKDNHYTQHLVLVTITQIDANYHGLPIPELAEDWRDILDTELRAGLQELSDEAVLQDLAAVAKTLLALVVITVIFILAKSLVRRYQRRFSQRKKELQEISEPDVVEDPIDPQGEEPEVAPEAEPEEQMAHQRNHFLQGFDEVLSLDRRLSILSFIQWLLFWSLIFIWYVGLYRLVGQFPLLEQYSSSIIETPIKLLAIWFFMGLAIRVCHRLIDRFTVEREAFGLGDLFTFGDAKRRQLRASTIAGAAKGLVTILLFSFGLLLGFGTLGLPTGSVLAIGGVFALAISFGSQSLVKDLVNGFLILAEDQFAIGDVIDTGTASGLVENLNLRVTQVRSVDGGLITIPNSNITQVTNLTRNWSRVAFSLNVAYQTNPDEALQVIRDVAQKLYEDPDWHDKIIAEPNVLGIDSVSHTGITITTWIQTEPAQQWMVGREFRLRVRRALAEQGIEIGIPRQSYMLESEEDNGNGTAGELIPQESKKP